MKETSGRRSFIRNIGIGGMSAAILPTGIVAAANKKAGSIEGEKQMPGKNTRPYNTPYHNEYLNRVAFPIGGIGAGMFCMEGTGAISHMSVKNRPDIFNEPGIFAAVSVKGIKNGAKVLEGPVPDWKKFGQRDAGNGLGGATTGLPHFRNASFDVKFPFAHLSIDDADLPLKVVITGWSPFIPTDENNSGMPAGAIEYTFTNTGSSSIEAVFSFNSKNFLREEQGNNSISSIANGFILSEAGAKNKPMPSDFAIFTDDAATVVDHCWFRGGWWDPITMAWNAVKNAEVKSVAPVDKDAPGASLYVPFTLAKGMQKTIRVMMAWYTPDSEYTYGTMGTRKGNCDAASGCCNSPSDIGLDKYDKDFGGKFYKPWYSSRFSSVKEVSNYWKEQYNELKKNSLLFTHVFYKSTLPPEVIEAVAANLTILKSPTVMRQYDGRLWSFEGCGTVGDVVMDPVHMCGIMPRLSHTYSRRWKGPCAILNSAKARMKKATRISDRCCPFNQQRMNFMQQLMDSSAAS